MFALSGVPSESRGTQSTLAPDASAGERASSTAPLLAFGASAQREVIYIKESLQPVPYR